MKKTLLFAAVISVCLLAVPAAGAAMANTSTPGAEYELSGWFRDIEVDGLHIVEYSQGKSDPGSVKYTIPVGLEEFAEVIIQGNALVVRWKEGVPVGDAHIVATVSTPRLGRVTVSGNGEVTVKGRLKNNNLKVTVNGEGRFSVRGVKSRFIETAVYGTGRVDISGVRSDVTHAIVSGGGQTDLQGRTRKARFDVHGSDGEIVYIDMKVKSLNYIRHRD